MRQGLNVKGFTLAWAKRKTIPNIKRKSVDPISLLGLRSCRWDRRGVDDEAG